MARSVRRWAAAIALVSGGWAVAQPWPAVPPESPPVQGSPPPAPPHAPDPPAEDATYVIRTAGQADRVVRLVHPAEGPDGLAEVMDTSTRQTFVIPGKVLAKLPRPNAARQEPPAVTPPAPPPTPVQPKPQFFPPPDQLPPLPTTARRPAPTPNRMPVQVASGPPTEKTVVTWRANVSEPPPPAVSPIQTVSATTTEGWQVGEKMSADEIVLLPGAKPRLAPGPRRKPAPSWRIPHTPTPAPAAHVDPWRASGDG